MQQKAAIYVVCCTFYTLNNVVLYRKWFKYKKKKENTKTSNLKGVHGYKEGIEELQSDSQSSDGDENEQLDIF